MTVASADLPLALRPSVDFPPSRVSIFEDPGDEKSWHRSQRSESLCGFYGDREPSWYASAIAPLSGAERVLDLGCGPGLALQALLSQGATSVWGVDRWPSFATGPGESARVVSHDLTLPMPFFSSGSFDGILSHYALDYLSPIGMRQVLREAQRVLAPDGRIVIYVAAVGLGSRDETRTAAYRPSTMRLLLEEAGFDRIEADAPGDGRNSVVEARCPLASSSADGVEVGRTEVRIDRELQVSGSFFGDGGVGLELTGRGRHALFRFELSEARSAEGARRSLCARVQRSASGGGAELQVWVWQGFSPVVSERIQLEFAPVRLRLECGGRIDHVCTWSPGELSVEPPGNAYRQPEDLPRADALTEAERGAEGRQIVVESRPGARIDPTVCLGAMRNRFLIRRATAVGVSEIDSEWLSGRAHGIVLLADELVGEGPCDLLLWAGWRDALVFLGGSDWGGILAAASRCAELPNSLVLVDPALSAAAPPQPPPPEVALFARAGRSFVLLGARSLAHTGDSDLEVLAGQLLHGGPSTGEAPYERVATENLRYLTERTLLTRLRQAHGRSPAEVGRRPL